jgi:heme/copper-type cytochrome/quinol oxidase subunit 4
MSASNVVSAAETSCLALDPKSDGVSRDAVRLAFALSLGMTEISFWVVICDAAYSEAAA